MEQKYLRALLGAFLGGFLSVFIASTFNMPLLLLVGAVIGWLIGYHGDRLRDGVKVGSSQTFAIAAKSASSMRDFGGATLGALRHIPSIIAWFGSFVFRKLYAPIRAARGFNSWYDASIDNQVKAWRISVALLVGLTYVGVYVTAGFMAWPILETNTPNPLNYFTAFMMFGGVVTGFCWSFVYFGADEETDATYYARLERFDNTTPLRFAWQELRYCLRSTAFCLAITIFVSSMLVTFMFGGVSLLLMIAIGFMPAAIIWFSGLATYKIIKASRDYGFVSLLVGLLVGTVTFYLYQPALVADPMFRLGASFAAGAGASVLAFLLRLVSDRIIQLPNTLRRKFGSTDYWFDSILNKIDPAVQRVADTIRQIHPYPVGENLSPRGKMRQWLRGDDMRRVDGKIRWVHGQAFVFGK